ncbi:MAG: AAA family ATPase [Lachnospiraceae bacterium]|nr:AAA family ATPase [Lachnospiraceae bacterium]
MNNELFDNDVSKLHDTSSDGKSRLNPKYRFSSFIIDENNKIAYKVALGVAKVPLQTNPLYIYSGPGLGKTHLLQAIGNYIVETDPDINVVYTTGNEFTDDVISAIRSGVQSKISSMRDYYRSADVLIVDDINTFMQLEATREEFFNIFQSMLLEDKQLIVSADKAPKDLSCDEWLYKSRINMGLIVKIDPPLYSAKRKVIETYAQHMGYQMDEMLLDYLAHETEPDYRDMEAACIRCKGYSLSKQIQ